MASKQTPMTVVAAVDFDESGAAALREAFRIVRRIDDAELHVVHVLRTSGGDLAKLEETLEHTLDLLRAHAAWVADGMDLTAEDGVEPIGHVRIGTPAAAIHQLAVDVDADLIIVGTHARRGLEKIVLGSVSDELVKMAHAPVMVARAKDYSRLGHTDSVLPPRSDQDMDAPSVTRKLTLARVARTSHMPGLL